MFTLDTESGFRDVVFITSSYGLGETVVQGAVNPDEFYVHKTDAGSRQVQAILRRNHRQQGDQDDFTAAPKRSPASRRTVDVDKPATVSSFRSAMTRSHADLARQAHDYRDSTTACPMDIEWAKDGIDGKLYIVQARPETVKSRRLALARLKSSS
jgi:pyruvate,water dikinase